MQRYNSIITQTRWRNSISVQNFKKKHCEYLLIALINSEINNLFAIATAQHNNVIRNNNNNNNNDNNNNNLFI